MTGVRLPRVRRLDRRAWLLTGPSSGVRPVRLGPAGEGLTVLFDPATARRRPNTFEHALTDFAARRHVAWLLRELRVDVVLDVGANRGQYARVLRRGGYRGRIASFEPVPDLVAVLRRKAAADGAWQVHDYALGEEDGEAPLHVVPESAVSSLLEASDFGKEWLPKMRTSHAETIRVRRLDAVLDEVTAGIRDPRVYLKLDTQGFDLQAFRGAGERVGELLGMQSEVSCVPIYDGMPRMAEQLTAYEQAGFALTGMFPVSRDRPTLRVIEFDAYLVGPRALAERRAGAATG